MKFDLKMILLGLVAMSTFTSKGKGPGGGGGQLRVPKDGARMTLDELRALAAQVGFADPDLAAAVAMAESGGFAGAIGDNGQSIGLWQIHMPSHPSYDKQKLFDPSYNASAAKDISQAGTTWQPWTTYRTGAYRRYMPAATPAIAADAPPPAQLEPPPPATSSSAEAVAEVVDVAPYDDEEPA